MYAIVDIAGQQFKVEKDQKIFVHRLEALEGAQVITIAELLKQFLMNGPKAITTLRSEFSLDMLFEIRLDMAVIQQSVVHIHQKNNGTGLFHGKASRG